MTTGESVFDDIAYSKQNSPWTVPARIVDTVLQDVCDEARDQYDVVTGQAWAWSDSTDYGLSWSGYFAPVRSNYTSVSMWEAAFNLDTGENAYVEAYQCWEIGAKTYLRSDSDSINRIRRIYTRDSELNSRTYIYKDEVIGGGA